MGTIIESWVRHLRARRVSEASIRLWVYYVERFTHRCDVIRASAADIEAWLSCHCWANETARSARSALARFYSWATSVGIVTVDPMEGVRAVRESPAAARPCPEDVYRLAIAGADARTRLAIRLAGEAGLRRAEAAAVFPARDLVRGIGGAELLVHGKGGRERVCPVLDNFARELSVAAEGGWLFPGPLGHLTAGTVGKLVSDALPEGWSMHSLRHRFATVCYAASGDIRAVQQLLGHVSVATTQRYVAVDAARLRAVAASAA